MNAILNTSKVSRIGKAGFALALGLLIGVVATVIGNAQQIDRSDTPDGILEALGIFPAAPGLQESTASGGFTLECVAQTTEQGFVISVAVHTTKRYLQDPDILSSIVAAVAARQVGFQRLEAENRKDNKQVFALFFTNAIAVQPFEEQLTKVLSRLANRAMLTPA